MALIRLVLALAVIALVAWGLVQILGRGQPRTADLRAKLLRICRGDEERLERLVARELKNKPGIEPVEALRRAIDSVQRDNR